MEPSYNHLASPELGNLSRSRSERYYGTTERSTGSKSSADNFSASAIAGRSTLTSSQAISKRDTASTENLVGIALTTILGAVAIWQLWLTAQANELTRRSLRRTAEDTHQPAPSIGSSVGVRATVVRTISQSRNIIADGVGSAQQHIRSVFEMLPSSETIGRVGQLHPSNPQPAVSVIDDELNYIRIDNGDGRSLRERADGVFELRELGDTERTRYIDQRFLEDIEQVPGEERILRASIVVERLHGRFVPSSDTDSDLGAEADASNEGDDDSDDVYFDAEETIEQGVDGVATADPDIESRNSNTAAQPRRTSLYDPFSSI
jgi:hypothetical protein